jgi:hypothetical protein
MARITQAKTKTAEILEAIAQKHCLHTLEETKSGADFFEIATWSLEAALQAAFEAGKAAR